MIFIGIVFVALIFIICYVIDDKDNCLGLVCTLLAAGIICIFTTFIVKCEETNDAVNLYKQGLLKEEITIKQTTKYGKVKIDTLYNYSRP